MSAPNNEPDDLSEEPRERAEVAAFRLGRALALFENALDKIREPGWLASDAPEGKDDS